VAPGNASAFLEDEPGLAGRQAFGRVAPCSESNHAGLRSLALPWLLIAPFCHTGCTKAVEIDTTRLLLSGCRSFEQKKYR